MANIISYASGNITGTTTFKNAGTGTNAFKLWSNPVGNNFSSTTTSDVYNANAQDFTITNSEVIEGVLLFCKKLTSTGTVTVTLSEDSGTTATRTVTVNAADLPTEYSPVFFKFASTLTADGGTDYAIAIKGSSSSNAAFAWASATSFDYAHGFRTSTTSTPTAADALYIVGEWTAAATGSAYSVTMDDTASTDWGTIDIGDSGTLTSGTAATTNYTLKHSGNLNVWGNGTYSIGTTGTPIPRGSTYTQTMDCTSNVEFGMIINAGGTFNSQGLSRTSGKNIFYGKLNVDTVNTETHFHLDTDSGWLSGDTVAIASTSRTAADCETKVLDGNAGAEVCNVTVAFGATVHSGTSPTQGEVILLTRSIVIQGASASNQGYIVFGTTSTVDIDWTEFKWLGSGTTSKRGIDNLVTTGSVNIQYSSLHDFTVTSSAGFNTTASTSSGWVFSNNVTYIIANFHFGVSVTTGTWTADSNIFMKNTDSINMVLLADNGGTFTNNTLVGSVSSGLSITENSGTVGTINNIVIHSCTGIGFATSANSPFLGTISSFTIWRCNTYGMQIAANSMQGSTISDFTFWGNQTGSINIAASIGDANFINITSNGDSTFSTGIGLIKSGVGSWHRVRFYNCDFSTVSGIKTAHTSDFDFSTTNAVASIDCVLNNCKLGASTEVNTQTNLSPNAVIGSQKHDQTAGNHKTWKKYGTITIDTTANMFRTASPSERLTPNNASNKLESGTRQIAVASGTALTPSVYVRESVVGDGTDYNGNFARLILKRNDAIGITADTVIDTATASSTGAFEQLTGTTATATDDGVMEFYVDCDGTTGWLNVDDWSVT